MVTPLLRARDGGAPDAEALAVAVAPLQVADRIDFDDAWQFQRARRVVREALADHGVAGEINDAVANLLRATAPPEAAAALTTVAT